VSVVFITGGARRIGRRLAERFAANGWSVGVTYNASVSEMESLKNQLDGAGIHSAFSQCDVAKEDQLRSSLDVLREHLGPPDVIVSNAGIFPDPKPIASTTPQDVLDAIAVNTLPLLIIARWLHAQLASSDQVRRLVAITSLGAVELWKDRLPYNVSKSAVQTMAYSLSRSLAPHIAVNSVAPGAIVMREEPSDSDTAVTTVERIPMKRYGSADDVFDAVHYFATCSPYITGQLIMVDGGYHRVR